MKLDPVDPEPWALIPMIVPSSPRADLQVVAETVALHHQ